jgi:hypothetical protein
MAQDVADDEDLVTAEDFIRRGIQMYLDGADDSIDTGPLRNFRGDYRLQGVALGLVGNPKKHQEDKSNWRDPKFRTVKHKDEPRQLGFGR